MPQVVITRTALADIARLRGFLRSKDVDAAQEASKAIIQAVQSLRHFPERGRNADRLGENYRELVIKFGGTGYIAIYRIDAPKVFVLAVRHQKEAGY
ncbi:MAG: type II toxin-antitoxin system RelE/ParE family toxin [Fibromonadales bacterium]|nr:type II toxin-antitoxin system RelE/ParE family toxin [Fibromonadales bacterium]